MENIENNDTSKVEVKQPSKIWVFIKKNKYYAILILLLLISIAYHFISNQILKNSFTNEKTTIKKI